MGFFVGQYSFKTWTRTNIVNNGKEIEKRTVLPMMEVQQSIGTALHTTTGGFQCVRARKVAMDKTF